ncbi:uncharacterized protein LOC130680156 isoform X4 [Manis pentadactyla]|uniref:uncharacterized protein LOC130680156 isoform X4 n=1 Tax=Manis pentadactyla TaxID=143292 RepID=UPI00255CE7F1|nr:uncharacterized protein LOC130680156 isoform X4 [Manis pentadactyla]
MMEFEVDRRKGLGYQPPRVFFAYLTYYSTFYQLSEAEAKWPRNKKVSTTVANGRDIPMHKNSRRLKGILLSRRHKWWSETTVTHENSPQPLSISPVRPLQDSFVLLLRTESPSYLKMFLVLGPLR